MFSSPGRPVPQMEVDQPQSLEEEFAEIVGQVLLNRASAKEAVGGMETICRRRAEAFRQEASQLLHRPARAMHLQALAAELDSQAATWHLVWCLHCADGSAAGTGGPQVLGAGGRRTARQALADAVTTDPVLARVASVVMWLESLAEDSLGSLAEAPGGTAASQGFSFGQMFGQQTPGSAGAPAISGAPVLSDHEGVWLETRHRLGQGGTVTELDPDAPSRQGKTLQADNVRAEERLLARCWQLVRAGHLQEAQALSMSCGAPWRGGSLSGPTGGWGPLPVGTAAARVEEELRPEEQAEELAAEVMCGISGARSLWKWAAQQAAQQAMSAGGPGGRYEAALYGVLSGYLPAILPVCSTWEDACWAYCRVWLDNAADSALEQEQAAVAALQRSTGLLISGDVLVEVARRAAGNSSQAGAAAKATVESALSLNVTPHSGLSSAGGDYPRSLEGVFRALAGSEVQGVAQSAHERLRQIQQALAVDAMSALTQQLYAWVNNTAGGDSAADADGGTAMDESGTESTTAPDVLGLPAAGHTRMAAFGAHLMLVLEALGVLPSGQYLLQPRPSLFSSNNGIENRMAAERVSGQAKQVVGLYTASLLDRHRYALVPQYLCHLSPHLRSLMSQELLSALTQGLAQDTTFPASVAEAASTRQAHQPTVAGGVGEGGSVPPGVVAGSDALCFSVYEAMDHWFGACFARQARQMGLVGGQGEEADAVPQSFLATDIRPLEARRLVVEFVQGSVRLSPSWGAAARVRAARWLFYPFLLRRDAGSDPAAEAEYLEAEGPWVWSDALELTAALCCELAVGPSSLAAQGLQLLTSIMPHGFEAAAHDAAGVLRVRAHGLETESSLSSEAAHAAALAQGPDSEQAQAAREAADAASARAAALMAAADGVERLLAEVGAWRAYLTLAVRVATWRADYEALQAHGPGPLQASAVEQAMEEGRALLSDLLALLRSGWLQDLEDPPSASAATAGGDEGSSGSGRAAGLSLWLTAAPSPSSAAAGAAGEGVEVDPSSPYPYLKGAALAGLQQGLQSAAEAARVATGGPPLSLDVSAAEGAQGFVRVTLGWTPGHTEAWQEAVSIASALASSSAPGQPKVLVVNLESSGRGTSIEICRRVCLRKAIGWAARLRLSLASLGGDGSDGGELVELLAAADLGSASAMAAALAGEGVSATSAAAAAALEVAASGLKDVLEPGLVREVLSLEADTVVAALANAQNSRQRGRAQ